MAHVRGIGGIFFRSDNPEALYAWYQEHLGISSRPGEGAMFHWRRPDDPSREDLTVWSIFPSTTEYFKGSPARFMLNYIVDDLDGTLAELRAKGAQVDDHTEEYDYGKFGWVMDPEGNRIELWEPKQAK
jgi:predicted enzyme related to lactoylglutathione lyase